MAARRHALKSEDTQCSEGHYDYDAESSASLIAVPLGLKTPNARKGITTVRRLAVDDLGETNPV